MSALSLVPHNEERSLLPLIEKIGRAVKFEYLSSEGELIQSEGIIDKVTESGIEICIDNPVCRREQYFWAHERPSSGLRSSQGWPKYFPFERSFWNSEVLVRILDINMETRKFEERFVNTVERLWYQVKGIIAGE